MPDDEWDAISLNYTSGTTGNPKGVVYHHRGAALMAYGNVLTGRHGQARRLSLDAADVPLQRLVLSLDDGGGRPAPMSACAGCGRRRSGTRIADHGVTHLCGAPIVMSTLLIDSAEPTSASSPQTVEFFTAAAPPPEAVLAAHGAMPASTSPISTG